MTDLLTPEEHRLMMMIGKVNRQFHAISENGPTKEQDLTEIRNHIHALQNWVLAQAAARAYPQEYRTLGGTTK